MPSSRASKRAALLLALSVALGGCRAKQPAQEPAPVVALGPEDLTQAALGQLQTGPQVSGRLEAVRLANLRAEIAGSVKAAPVPEGAQVQPGQLLAQIDPAASPSQRRAAAAAVGSAQRAAADADADAARMKKLAQAGAASRQDLDHALAQAASAQAQLAQARAQLAQASEQLGHTEVTAPFAGKVSARHVSPGDIVQVGTPLYEVIDPSDLRLEASVPAQDLGALKVGTQVAFTVSGFGERRFAGQIVRINPVVDAATGQVRLYVDVPNPDGSLMAGLFAEGQVQARAVRGVVLPLAAIDASSGAPNVGLVQGDVVTHAPVKVLLTDLASQRAVVEGIPAGASVLRGGVRELPDGTRVKAPNPPAGQARTPAPRPRGP